MCGAPAIERVLLLTVNHETIVFWSLTTNRLRSYSNKVYDQETGKQEFAIHCSNYVDMYVWAYDNMFDP